MTETLLVIAAALVLDRLAGDPDWLWSRIPHPVVAFGKAISLFDRSFNTRPLSPKRRRARGRLAIALLLAVSAVLGLFLHALFLRLGFPGLLLEIVIVAVFLAHKSLADHVSRVADGLLEGGVQGGRRAVSMIVGRDPETLDEAGVSRAAIESLAENFSDGVVAPAFWYVLLGLPGLFAYKMLNTADSMVGHKNEAYLDFGRASARLDDWANLLPARLSALLIACGAWRVAGRDAGQNALEVAARDHGLHRSPNSGWPEAAMAGALGIGLAGPRVYGGVRVEEPMMNGAGRLDARGSDIRRAVKIFDAAGSAFTILAVLLLLIL